MISFNTALSVTVTSTSLCVVYPVADTSIFEYALAVKYKTAIPVWSVTIVVSSIVILALATGPVEFLTTKVTGYYV